jgi:maleate cis-trans isomerase
MRRYNFSDRHELANMLMEEEIPPLEHNFSKGLTHVLVEDDVIKGFFTISGKVQSGYPYLMHFCTKKKHRTPKLARTLTSALVEAVKALGANKFIINCPLEKNYLKRVIRYYFKTKPYGNKSNHEFTLVEV